jgi:hypothetical protein
LAQSVKVFDLNSIDVRKLVCSNPDSAIFIYLLTASETKIYYKPRDDLNSNTETKGMRSMTETVGGQFIDLYFKCAVLLSKDIFMK